MRHASNRIRRSHRMRRSRVVWFLTSLLVIGACGREDRDRAQQAKRETGEVGAPHAAAGVVPGSYEDWCSEHQVPETQCTRCEPALVPAFKATGDWCAEHGLPESQCLLCNPQLEIVRPPKPEAR